MSRNVVWRAFGVLGFVAMTLRSSPVAPGVWVWSRAGSGIVSVAAASHAFEREAIVREGLRPLVPLPQRQAVAGQLEGDLMKKFVAVVGACAFLVGAACSDVSFVDEVSIVNNTEYPANADLAAESRDGWLGLLVAKPESTTTVEEVIDQGEVWIFRFDYGGEHEEEVEVTRQELERNDWTIEVPLSFEQRLHDLGVPVAP